MFSYDPNTGAIELFLSQVFVRPKKPSFPILPVIQPNLSLNHLNAYPKGYQGNKNTGKIIAVDDKNFIMIKNSKYEVTIVDGENPYKKSVINVQNYPGQTEENDGIFYFYPIGNSLLLVLLGTGIILIYSYKNMKVSLQKKSDNLDFEGEVTAIGFNKKYGLIGISQFKKVQRSVGATDLSNKYSQRSSPKTTVWVNTIRFYRLRLDNWIWLEFLEEKDSADHSSMEGLKTHQDDFILLCNFGDFMNLIFLDFFTFCRILTFSLHFGLLFEGDMSFFNNVNMERCQKEGIVVACTRYAGSFEFVAFFLNREYEALDYDGPFEIHIGKLKHRQRILYLAKLLILMDFGLILFLDRINTLTYWDGAYWSYSDDGTVCRITSR